MLTRLRTGLVRLAPPLVALSLLAAGCSSDESDSTSASSAPETTSSTAASTVESTTVPVTTESTVPDSAASQPTAVEDFRPSSLPEPVDIEWSSCGSIDCATVPVPLDFTDPDGPTIDLALARRRATGPEADRRGTVFVNFGGPGGQGAARAGSFRLPGTLGQELDVITWDPRGVEGSGGLGCRDRFPDEPTSLPDNGDGYEDEVLAAQAVWDDVMACAAESPLIDHIGTVAVANDLDLLRRSVGDTELRYLGYSYGTEIGWVYATLFPENVGAMVLDGAVPPGTFSTAGELTRYPEFDEAVLRLDQACDRVSSCPLSSEGLVETVNRLYEELEANPLPLADGTTFGPIDLAVVLTGLTYLEPQSIGSTGATWIDRIDDGQPAGAAGFKEALNRGFEAATFWSVICADGEGQSSDEEAIAAYEALAAAAPLTAGVGVDIQFCHRYPGAIPGLPELDTEGAGPILVVGNTGDAATPYEWSVDLDAQLHDSTLLTYHGGGHTIVGSNACIDEYVVTYFRDRTLPPAGTSCGSPDGDDGWLVPIEIDD